jgi:hypothetical protein
MNFKKRIAKILSVFFYAYGGAITPLAGFIAATDPVNFTLYNLIVWPSLAGMIAIFPQLGKMFGEISNVRKS